MLIKLIIIFLLVSCGVSVPPTPPKPDPKLDFKIEKIDYLEVIGRLGDKSNLKVECVKEEFDLAVDLLNQ